jgi:internalin A
MFAPFSKDGSKKNHVQKKGRDKREASVTNIRSILDADKTQLDEVEITHGSFSKFPLLDNLDLGNNLLSQIPLSVSLATNLSQLQLMGNMLTYQSVFPIFQLHNLTLLDLNFNQLTKIPFQFTSFSKLSSLLLYGNKVEVIPVHLNKLTSLQKLNLSENKVNLIESKAFEGLHSMRQLLLPYNSISSIYDGAFASMTSLHTLVLNNNQLTTLPDSLSRLGRLRSFNVSYNNLQSLPPMHGQ